MGTKKKSALIPFLIALPSIGLGLAWNMNSTVVPLLVKTVTPSAFKLAVLVTMAPVTGIIFPYIAGALSDRTNMKLGKRKPWVLIGGIIGAVALFLLGFSTTYIEMFIFAFIVYASLNFYQGAYYSWMPEAVEANQIGLVTGLGKLFFSLGGVIVFFTGVSLFDKSNSLPFIVVLIVVLIPIILATLFVKEDTSKFHKPSKLSLEVLKNVSAMKVFMCAFFFYIGYGLIMPFWLPYYSNLGISDANISYALVGFTAIGLILSLFVGMWCDRFNKQIIFLIACIIFGASFIIGWWAHTVTGLWIFTIVYGLGFGIMNVVFYALIPVVSPKEKLGEYMGINNVFLCIPQIVGNLIGGSLISNGRGWMIFPISIAALVIACIIIGAGKIKPLNPDIKL
ncbi:MFS transporter [Clostridium thermobutyricum]|uniref:MFS transporter n=1 Tax=Clostridium thermobutyricum TaxID=29372 RepID=UPI0018ABCDDD|nr:MFS transporter [Clostridium thermobutyricum]